MKKKNKTRSDTGLLFGFMERDAQQLEKYITDNGGEVDTWFITHPHIDHAGAFEIISQNTSIKINKIYMSIEDKDWYLTNEPSRTIDIEEFLDQQGPNSNKNNNEDTTTENTTDVNTIEKNNVNNTEVSETTSDTDSQSDKTIETTGTDGN